MSARTKLNGIAFGAVMLFAALIGNAANSWLVFVIATVIGTLLMIHAGEVRLKASDRRFGRQAFRGTLNRR